MSSNLRSNKRKEITPDIVENEDEDNSYDLNDNFIDDSDPENVIDHEKANEVRKKMKDNEVTFDKIFEMNLPEDEQYWFVEHLDILYNTERYTEDYVRIRNMITNRYQNLEKNLKQKDTINRLKQISNTETDILTRICESKLPDNIKAIIFKKYAMLSELDKSEEYFKIMTWIEMALEIPTELRISKLQNNSIADLLLKLRSSLDEKIFGLESVKERIIEAYCATLTNPNYKKKILTLVGPPGVGKTAIGKAIASAFNQEFEYLPFGNIKDPHILTGFPITYIGSRPGEFVNMLRNAKSLDPVMFLDEIDKITNSVEGASISDVLLHAVDKIQNDRFKDAYFHEIPINLSHVFFILSMNDDNNIDPILKDRLCLIKIDGYTLEQKIIIGKNYILPKALSELNFANNDIVINDAIMSYIIGLYEEKGVREFERNIYTICEKLNVLKNTNNNKSKKRFKFSYSIDNLSFPLNITQPIVDKLIKN